MAGCLPLPMTQKSEGIEPTFAGSRRDRDIRGSDGMRAPNSVANQLSTLFARAWQRNPLLIMSLDYLGQFAAQLCFVDIRIE